MSSLFFIGFKMKSDLRDILMRKNEADSRNGTRHEK